MLRIRLGAEIIADKPKLCQGLIGIYPLPHFWEAWGDPQGNKVSSTSSTKPLSWYCCTIAGVRLKIESPKIKSGCKSLPQDIVNGDG